MKTPKNRQEHELHPKSQKLYSSIQKLCTELESKTIPEPIVSRINEIIENLNRTNLETRKDKSQIHKAKQLIITTLRQELKIVPKNYYRNLWMVLGMSALGIPFGVAFGIALDNLAFMGIGIPIGMSIGMAMGAGMDEKAKKEGRQLSFEVDF